MKTIVLLLSGALRFCVTLNAESQGTDYKGITDPFGDPANYEFSEDEKEDKEFFHLGRYLMVGADLGVGFFTGGLGRTNSPGFQVGARVVYFFDKSVALEMGVHYGQHEDTLALPSGTRVILSTTMLPILAGFRYYFDTKSAPKAVAVANPYLVGGGGLYIRKQAVISNVNTGLTFEDVSNNNYGGFLGGGAEFNVYRKHIYMGVDLRYHFVFFIDEDETLKGNVEPGSRGGDYMTTRLTITYSF